MTRRPEFLPFLLALVDLLGLIALAAAGVDSPTVLKDVLYALVGAGAGVAHPGALQGLVDAVRPSGGDPAGSSTSSTAGIVVTSETDTGA